MRRIVWLLTLLVAPLACFAQGSNGPLYGEPYRPGYHFSHDKYWMNEPNGPFFANGLWHVFTQHNDFHQQFGSQGWGHAVSPDLLHWTELPVAIPATTDVLSYSGSAILDANNDSGLGTPGNPPIIAAYTGRRLPSNIQDQRLAFSLDDGMTWTKFSGNPVLDINSNEFRDPKLFFDEPSQQWIMVIAQGGQNRVSFYRAPSPIGPWTFSSIFRDQFLPAGIGGWEVPDMFELRVDGNPNDTRWVLVITPATGSPAGGNGVFYFVGSFDGITFTREQVGTALWADYGRDWDGVMSWENVPAADGRRIWAGIMNSYGGDPPWSPFKGMLSIPREVELISTPNGLRLTQQPIAEVATIREPGATITTDTPVSGDIDLTALLGVEGQMLEVIARFDPGTAFDVGIDVAESMGGTQRTRVAYRQSSQQLYMDRQQSGNVSYNPAAGGVHFAPLELDTNGEVTMRILVDRSSIEVFPHDGMGVISNLIFPAPSSTRLSMFATSGTATLKSLEVYPLRETWTVGPDPVPGEGIIARYSMDPTPQSTDPGYNPASIDARQGLNEGDLIGALDPQYELDPAVENLFRNSTLGGNPFVTSGDVPPPAMFVDGELPGEFSYNAGAYEGVNGALFVPTDLYGEEFNFQGSFSVEMYFKTDGDRSGDGRMTLIRGGQDSNRFSVEVNRLSPGNVRFGIFDAFARFAAVDISTVSPLNYADGEWHYLLATYDADAGSGGTLSLTIINEDGTTQTASNAPASFGPLADRDDGSLLIGRNTFNATGAERTFLGLIDEVRLSKIVIDEGNMLGSAAGRPITRWRMDPAPGLPSPPSGANPVTLDARIETAQGTDTGVSGLAEPLDHLWSFNALPGQTYSTSADVPPSSMFTAGEDAGAVSYDASAIDGVNGTLFFPADQYGQELDFTSGFTIEAFFKTNGDQSNAGTMTLLFQGEFEERFSLELNRFAPGSLVFGVVDESASERLVLLTDRDHADGRWWYVRAAYIRDVDSDDTLELTAVSETGCVSTSVTSLGGGVLALPTQSDGNLLIGRRSFLQSETPNTFLGLIDEVQFSIGTPSEDDLLGVTPASPPCPGDANGDGMTTTGDITFVVSNLGSGMPGAVGTPGDVNSDGITSTGDITFVVSNLGSICACP